MSVLNRSAHKVLLKTGGAANVLGNVEHIWIKDFEAALLAEFGMWPITLSNSDPGVSRLMIWFDPSGSTTTDAENAPGLFKISNNGTSWISSPTAADWRVWLQYYLIGSGGSHESTEYNLLQEQGVATREYTFENGTIYNIFGIHGDSTTAQRNSYNPKLYWDYSLNSGTTWTNIGFLTSNYYGGDTPLFELTLGLMRVDSTNYQGHRIASWVGDSLPIGTLNIPGLNVTNVATARIRLRIGNHFSSGASNASVHVYTRKMVA